MTKSFSLSLVMAGACLAGAGGCSPNSETTTPTEKVGTSTTESDDAKVEATEEAATTKTSGAQKRTPTGAANVHAAAARPASDAARRAAAAPTLASGPSHAVRQAQPTASAAGARTSSAIMSGAMAKPAADVGDSGNDLEVRGARVSRAVPAASADGRVDNAARMLQLEAGEGESAG